MIIAAITACGNNSGEKSAVHDELKSRIGKKLDLPFVSDNRNEYRFKIVSFINGDCPSCLENMDLWEDFIPQINNKDSILFIIYLCSSNFDYLKKYCKLLSNPFVTIIEDNDKIFYKSNSLSDNKMFHTFITNQSNEILLVGNPVLNKNLEVLYLKLINNGIAVQKIVWNYKNVVVQESSPLLLKNWLAKN